MWPLLGSHHEEGESKFEEIPCPEMTDVRKRNTMNVRM